MSVSNFHATRWQRRLFGALTGPTGVGIAAAWGMGIAACTGNLIGGQPGQDGIGPTAPGPASAGGTSGVAVVPPEDLPSAQQASVSGLRRLSAHEYDNTLRDLLNDSSRPGAALLPPDGREPFDNDYTQQVASKGLIDGLELVAREAVERLMQDAARRDAIVGCQPAAADDSLCYESFVSDFGRRALRRPVPAAEVERFAARFLPLASEADDFYVAVASTLQALLQHPELVYRVEVGSPVKDQAGLHALSDWEVASRLSYLLWASTPDVGLLDSAGAGQLVTESGIRTAAERLLLDSRARNQIARFHSLWLGYENMQGPSAALLGDMNQESAMLIGRVVFDDRRPWLDLFRSDDTFLTPALAGHYGLSGVPSGGGWLGYADSGRQGLLSHATFLSNGAKAGDTSPTLRGLAIRELLLCEEIPPPPPGVEVDEPPPAQGQAVCKEDRYAVHRQGGCAGCHSLMDPVGFGLEQFDQQGRFRSVEAANPDCAISGVGTLEGIGDFQGPAELSNLLIETGKLSSCVLQQLYRFAAGRSELTPADNELVQRLSVGVSGAQTEFKLDQLLVDYVADAAFRYRRAEEVLP